MRFLSLPKCHHFILAGSKLLTCLDELSFILPVIRNEKVTILLNSQELFVLMPYMLLEILLFLVSFMGILQLRFLLVFFVN